MVTLHKDGVYITLSDDEINSLIALLTKEQKVSLVNRLKQLMSDNPSFR